MHDTEELAVKPEPLDEEVINVKNEPIEEDLHESIADDPEEELIATNPGSSIASGPSLSQEEYFQQFTKVQKVEKVCSMMNVHELINFVLL